MDAEIIFLNWGNKMEISFDVFGTGVGLLHIDGKLTASNCDELKSSFKSWYAQKDISDVIINMKGVSFMDSTGLGVLISILQIVKGENGQMLLAELQQKPRMVMDITRAHRILPFYDSVEDALNAI